MNYLFKSTNTLNISLNPANFMSFPQNSMTHCPKCSKPLLNSGEFLGSAEFSMRCPWCQSAVLVVVRPKITVSLKPSEASMSGKEPTLKHSSQGEQISQLKVVGALGSDPEQMEVTGLLQSPNKDKSQKPSP